jgi:hypothetical protein
MIEKYPAALKRQDDCGYLPLHVECLYRCRLPIISKCIELYPEALRVVDVDGYLPLHCSLANESSQTDVGSILFLIKKYPAALEHKSANDSLPIHLECYYQCRRSIISKCIELYPESFNKYIEGVADELIPLKLVLAKILQVVTPVRLDKVLPAMSFLASIDPSCYSKLLHDPNIDCLNLRFGNLTRRLLLNILPANMLSPSFHQHHNDLNWKPRSSLIHLLLQMRMNDGLQEMGFCEHARTSEFSMNVVQSKIVEHANTSQSNMN